MIQDVLFTLGWGVGAFPSGGVANERARHRPHLHLSAHELLTHREGRGESERARAHDIKPDAQRGAIAQSLLD